MNADLKSYRHRGIYTLYGGELTKSEFSDCITKIIILKRKRIRK